VSTAIVVALAAAGCFAVANTLQHHGASQAPADRALRPSLLGHLLTRPIWLAGIGADLAGMLLHAFALSAGALAVVQPLLVCALLFALPVSRLVTGHRIRRADYGWTALIVAGLSAFLLAAHPTGGTAAAAMPALIFGVGGAGALAAAATAAAHRRSCRHRPLLLGLAAGTVCGIVAALIKQVTAIAVLGLPALLAAWPLYALLVAGAVALLLGQTAYQAGPLTSSLPAITIADPIVGTALGVLAFSETIAAGPGTLPIATAALVAVAAGVVALARRAGRASLYATGTGNAVCAQPRRSAAEATRMTRSQRQRFRGRLARWPTSVELVGGAGKARRDDLQTPALVYDEGGPALNDVTVSGIGATIEQCIDRLVVSP
jgi:drug/metabolite transporter (DMT)-like permease